ncbi:MAG: efflux RND transporter periplasmic adaptor subunit [Polyangiaceae bacterium]|jgi:HlyD family secretion protein|nr:efflux RND transporter periplasmic adaptor subunit [Polyangiaceae bacterium]
MNDKLSSDLASLRIDRSGPPSASRWPKIVLGLALLGGGAYAGLVYGRPYLEAQIFKTEVDVTEIGSLSPIQASVDLTATGYVVPQQTAKIGSKVVGRITVVNVKEGQQVKKGDVLFELDPTDQEAAISSSKARVSAASAKVLTYRATRGELELEHRRQKQLWEKGAVGKAVVEDLEARLKSVDAQIRAAEAETYALGTDVDTLKTGLKNLKIAAPIDGVVATKPVSIGDVASPGVPLTELIDASSLLVEADVSEGRLSLVKPGGPCGISLDALPGETFDGTVVEIGPRLNRAKATATVKVRFDKPPEQLRAEMSARVSFLQKALDEAAKKTAPKIVVPAAALVDRAGGKAVFVLEEGKVKLVPVKIGEVVGAGFVLESGPPPGTRIVNEPAQSLRDGQPVKEKGAT